MAISLDEAIARVPMWAGRSDIRTAPLGGGITNRNFRVDTGGESFVLRIGGDKTELLGIDRRNEYAANEAAAAIGLAPPVVYFIEPEGYLVTRFLEGRPLPHQDMGRAENIRRVAAELARFHAVPRIPGEFSPFRTVESYAGTARQYGVAFPSNWSWLAARLSEIETALRRQPFMPCPCHNDLLNENFLAQDSDAGIRIRILDWEYAGMGDPAFDLANFAVHHGFTEEQDRYLLECYLTPPHPLAPSPEPGTRAQERGQGKGVRAGEEVRNARHQLLKIASDCREAMWAMVQIGISRLEFDFRGYADKHFDRATMMIRDPRYSQWLVG